MLVNAAVQHRVKHFDLILSRELAFLQRQYEQHLISHDRFARAVRHQTKESNVSPPLKEIYNEETQTVDYRKLRKKKKKKFADRRPSIESSVLSQLQSDVSSSHETSSQLSQSRRRYCTKAQPLPPICSHRARRTSRSSYEKDFHWISNFSPSTSTLVKENDARLNDFGAVDEEIQSFLRTLPNANEIHHGFDSFASSSLYSTRGAVPMR